MSQNRSPLLPRDDLEPYLRPGLLGAAGCWTKLTTRPGLATGVASMATLAGTVLLYREIPTLAVGLLALYLVVLEVASTLGSPGFTTVVTLLALSAATTIVGKVAMFAGGSPTLYMGYRSDATAKRLPAPSRGSHTAGP